MIFHPSIKLALSHNFSRFIRDDLMTGCFENIEISTTSKCNADCECCFYRNENHKDADISIENLGLFLSKCDAKAVTWTGGGEPTLHPGFGGLVDTACSLMYKQGLITNGLKEVEFDISKMSWIRVSMTNKPMNQDLIIKYKSKCEIVGLCINYTGSRDLKLIWDCYEFAQKYNLDYVQVRPAVNLKGEYTYIEPPMFIGDKLEITYYKFEDCRKDRDYNKCYGFNFVPFIWETGEVHACAYHYGDDRFKIGDINKNTAFEIMNACPRYVNVVNTCQICCKNHETNKFINYGLKIKNKEFM